MFLFVSLVKIRFAFLRVVIYSLLLAIISISISVNLPYGMGSYVNMVEGVMANEI